MAADVKYARYPIVVGEDEKEVVVVRYKEVVSAALTEGKTAAQLKEAVVVKQGEEPLPDIAEVKYLATRVCKIIAGEDAGKFAVIASLRYIG